MVHIGQASGRVTLLHFALSSCVCDVVASFVAHANHRITHVAVYDDTRQIVTSAQCSRLRLWALDVRGSVALRAEWCLADVHVAKFGSVQCDSIFVVSWLCCARL